MSTKYRFIPLITLLATSLLLAGCDGDPENDDDIIDLDDIVDIEAFDISNYTKLETSTSLAGLWVAAGTGTFARDKGGDAKFGDQVALIYFVVKGEDDAYEYANCFDTGTLEQSYNRGGFEPLTIGTGDTVTFDSSRENSDGDEELLSAEDDYPTSGTLTDSNEIDSVFTFNDGDSVETNTFKMIKVSELTDFSFGTTEFSKTGSSPSNDKLTCFAQWVGSYDTTEGLYQVERYDASMVIADEHPFSTSDYDSDDEDTEKQYSNISYEDVSVTAQEDDDGDGISAHFFDLSHYLTFYFESSSVDYEGNLTITHTALTGEEEE